MNLFSYLVQRRSKLLLPATRDLAVLRDLRVPMPGGVDLPTERWVPKTGGDGLPTALIRTPYGRSGPFGAIAASPLPERGCQVLVKSTRGGFGSGGTFPSYVRNPGTGEPRATATILRTANQTVHRVPAHPSAVVLPGARGPV
ncbi:CocE/NonD family hydrolase [Streptomyces fuscichromogenes]|uniref:CocE/NonD family hydrolase n=1 Tax=Streptomyces fuscichromogenes TaxID=1324013 RepID=UPI00382506B8